MYKWWQLWCQLVFGSLVFVCLNRSTALLQGYTGGEGSFLLLWISPREAPIQNQLKTF